MKELYSEAKEIRPFPQAIQICKVYEAFEIKMSRMLIKAISEAEAFVKWVHVIAHVLTEV